MAGVSLNAEIHISAVVEKGAIVGDGTKIWHFSHIREGAEIGSNCQLGQNVYVDSGAVIGNGCKLQNNVSIYEGVTLEDYVFCGPSCVFTNDLTPRAKFPKGVGNRVRTVVREGATIGANATIVCGNEIGEWAMVAAGAVVTSDVPSHGLVVGIPARRIGWVCQCGEVLPETLICPKCRKAYSLSGVSLCLNDCS